MNNQKYFGNYAIQASLSEDRFFKHYQAFDAARKRSVVVKILKPEVANDHKQAGLFLERAQLTCELVHPHLAWTWEASKIDNQYFLVERCVEGPSLRQLLITEPKLSKEKAQVIIHQISRGLSFAHAKGLFHGNIKPENIVINPDLGAIVTNIGASISLQAIIPRWANTIDGEMAPYTAPEIWRGASPTAESDQYSLACIFAEMLSGEQTFGAASVNQSKEKHLAVFQTPISWAGSIPWPIVQTILRAQDEDPSKRFSDLETFSEAPENIKEEFHSNPQLKLEAEIQLQAWQAVQQKAQQEQEEAARIEALEKARQEIEEELRRQRSQNDRQHQDQSEPIDEENKFETNPRSKRHRNAQKANIRTLWLLIILSGVILAVASIWLINKPTENNYLPTTTPTLAILLVNDTPTSFSSPTAEPSNTSFPSPTSTNTPTKTATTTKTPTATSTNTETPTTTTTKTPTKISEDEDTTFFSSPILKSLEKTQKP